LSKGAGYYHGTTLFVQLWDGVMTHFGFILFDSQNVSFKGQFEQIVSLDPANS